MRAVFIIIRLTNTGRLLRHSHPRTRKQPNTHLRQSRSRASTARLRSGPSILLGFFNFSDPSAQVRLPPLPKKRTDFLRGDTQLHGAKAIGYDSPAARDLSKVWTSRGGVHEGSSRTGWCLSDQKPLARAHIPSIVALRPWSCVGGYCRMSSNVLSSLAARLTSTCFCVVPALIHALAL